jgi:hypothetical protein
VTFTDDARTKLLDGFGSSKSGVDKFDSLVGLLSLIEVVEGRRPEGSAPVGDGIAWEGWILGLRS